MSKALQLLSAFRRARTDLSLTELAQRADIPKSTAFRLLGELEQAGFVARNGTKYRLGVSLFELGSRVSLCRPQGLRDTAVHYLSQLHAGTGGLTAHLAVLEGPEILYLEKIHGPRTPRVRTMPGQRYPASTTALGKAMVALGDAEDLAAVLEHGLPRMTRSSITDPDRFVEELRGVRRAGVARDREEAVAGTGLRGRADRGARRRRGRGVGLRAERGLRLGPDGDPGPLRRRRHRPEARHRRRLGLLTPTRSTRSTRSTARPHRWCRRARPGVTCGRSRAARR